MNTTIQALARHLRDRKYKLIKTIRVPNGRDDPTYGNTDDYEVVDFDALLESIDEFAAQFQRGEKPT